MNHKTTKRKDILIIHTFVLQKFNDIANTTFVVNNFWKMQMQEFMKILSILYQVVRQYHPKKQGYMIQL